MYVVPMYESESGWGGKIDGYAGLFDTMELAQSFKTAYNNFYNNEATVPDYYIVAQEPVPYKKGMKIDYSSTVNGIKFETVEAIK